MNNRRRTTSAVLAVLLLCAFFPAAAVAAEECATDKASQQNPCAGSDITVRIIPSVNRTFGYDILVGGRPLVHQPHVPALPGKEGFSTAEKARIVADFVAGKIRRNEMPPTVTIVDLNKMGVLK